MGVPWFIQTDLAKKSQPPIAVEAKSRQAACVMPRIRLGVPEGLGVAFACLILGCGPNVQMIYEGNVRFEHCYRLDLDPTIAPAHRRACWQDWLDRHTYAQTGDRLNHARQRLSQLDKGDQATLSLQLDAGAEGRAMAESVPMPSSIHAAPPPRALEAAPVPSAPPIAPPKHQTPPPEAECSDECRGRWNECSIGCDNQDSPLTSSANTETKAPMGVSVTTRQKNQKDACVNCRRAFKTCMRRCYK